jgi:mono/diheme cytochrome c family protein
MRLLICIFSSFLFLFASGCLQTENSSSTDADAVTSGSPEFLAAVSVLSSNCFSCHDEFNRTEDELITSGFVIPGDHQNSSIYYRLRNSSGPLGDKNMPLVGSLSTEDIQTIATWIDSITP